MAVALSVALMLLAQGASAQRTMRGQYAVSADALWSGTVPGGSLAFGQYLQSSLWEAGLSCRSFARSLSTGDTLRYLDVCAEGRWSYRLLSLRSRALSLYGGGGVFMGYEWYDPFGKVPDDIDTGLGDGVFLYGVSASLDAEVFVLRRLALVVGASAPVNFSSSLGHFRWEVSAGLRLNL